MPERLARVFPRKTKASPDDSMAFFGPPPYDVKADEVHIDVTFTADRSHAMWLAEQWRHVATVKMGGVAFEDENYYKTHSIEFAHGLYIKPGYTFTSRGCPRRCWFCSVWKRLPTSTPIPNFPEGWNVLDDNLLSCPRPHVEKVFAMLRQQSLIRRVEFTGGLEALALQDYQVGLLADLKPRPNCFFAYDPGDPFETLQSAARRMLEAGFTQESHRLRVFVLIGYPRDTFELAEKRLKQMVSIGFTPHAMLWQPETPSAEKYRPSPVWHSFQRRYARPAIIYASQGQREQKEFSFA